MTASQRFTSCLFFLAFVPPLGAQVALTEAEFRQCLSPNGATWCSGTGKCGSGLNYCILQGGTYDITRQDDAMLPFSTFVIGRSNIYIYGQYGSLPTIRRIGIAAGSLMKTNGQQSGLYIASLVFDGNRHAVGLGCEHANASYFDLNIESPQNGTWTVITNVLLRNSPSQAILAKGNISIQNVTSTYARSTGIYLVGNGKSTIHSLCKTARPA